MEASISTGAARFDDAKVLPCFEFANFIVHFFYLGGKIRKNIPQPSFLKFRKRYVFRKKNPAAIFSLG
jgi:hypothetical protein